MDTPFNRERFEAEARAAAPPMPADMTPAKDDLLDRTWFAWLFWPSLIIVVTGVGIALNRVLS